MSDEIDKLKDLRKTVKDENFKRIIDKKIEKLNKTIYKDGN